MTEKNRIHYSNLLETHGDTFEAAQYSSRASQEARFAVLASIADLNGAKILDFGCGTGHLATYLHQQGIEFSYTGVDILENFFVHGRAKHPEHRFGLWEEFCHERFDYVFVSGVFNNVLDDNWGFFADSVKKLFDVADKGLAFNLMSSYVDYRDPGLWYVDPERVFSYVKTITPYLTVRNDYVVKDTQVPFEFAVYAYRVPGKK
ncbi:class I SAM-dependent methyltransferase [Pseudomonas sichuanensis]|uniref:class I SAM-dependent methyltransferase n=1 Tax=Pseudomonas TaxID=286 RepID=UPI0036E1C3B5